MLLVALALLDQLDCYGACACVASVVVGLGGRSGFDEAKEVHHERYPRYLNGRIKFPLFFNIFPGIYALEARKMLSRANDKPKHKTNESKRTRRTAQKSNQPHQSNSSTQRKQPW